MVGNTKPPKKLILKVYCCFTPSVNITFVQLYIFKNKPKITSTDRLSNIFEKQNRTVIVLKQVLMNSFQTFYNDVCSLLFNNSYA